jgi:hypothetical protein
MRGRDRILAKIAAFACLAAFLPVAAGADGLTEAKVKSAFLYNFTKFVTWPPGSFSDSHQPLTICTLGPDRLKGTLEDTLNGKTVDGRRLTARQVSSDGDVKGCQVVFVAEQTSGTRAAFLREARMPNLLTVTEMEETGAVAAGAAISRGAIITFVLDENRMRFVINNGAAEKAGLSISSKLLNLALEVEK